MVLRPGAQAVAHLLIYFKRVGSFITEDNHVAWYPLNYNLFTNPGWVTDLFSSRHYKPIISSTVAANRYTEILAFESQIYDMRYAVPVLCSLMFKTRRSLLRYRNSGSYSVVCVHEMFHTS